MPDPQRKVPANVSGPFYVDEDCIDCTQCRNTAPDLFSFDEITQLSFVARQPRTDLEQALAEEAKEQCPVEAIGNDGSQAPHGTQGSSEEP